MPELLENRKIRQTEFARALNVSDSFVSQVKTGEAKFSYEMAGNAARILRCKMEDLYEWFDDKGNR